MQGRTKPPNVEFNFGGPGQGVPLAVPFAEHPSVPTAPNAEEQWPTQTPCPRVAEEQSEPTGVHGAQSLSWSSHLPSHLPGFPPELCATENVGVYWSQLL